VAADLLWLISSVSFVLAYYRDYSPTAGPAQYQQLEESRYVLDCAFSAAVRGPDFATLGDAVSMATAAPAWLVAPAWTLDRGGRTGAIRRAQGALPPRRRWPSWGPRVRRSLARVQLGGRWRRRSSESEMTLVSDAVARRALAHV
jgi:hypothetical protein